MKTLCSWQHSTPSQQQYEGKTFSKNGPWPSCSLHTRSNDSGSSSSGSGGGSNSSSSTSGTVRLLPRHQRVDAACADVPFCCCCCLMHFTQQGVLQ